MQMVQQVILTVMMMILLCTPAATAAEDMLALNLVSVSLHSYLPLIRLNAHYLSSPARPVHEQSAQGWSLNFAASTAQPLQLQAPTSDRGSQKKQCSQKQQQQQLTAAANNSS